MRVEDLRFLNRSQLIDLIKMVPLPASHLAPELKLVTDSLADAVFEAAQRLKLEKELKLSFARLTDPSASNEFQEQNFNLASYVPKVTYDNRFSASIDDYYNDFAWIWARDLRDRQLGVFDLIQHVFDHASRVCRAIRLEHPRGVIDDLADTTAWMMSLLAQCEHSLSPLDLPFRLRASLSDILWSRYPGMCPACFDYELVNWLGHGDDLSDKVCSNWESLKSNVERSASKYSAPVPCTCLARFEIDRELRPKIHGLRSQLDELREIRVAVLRASGQKPVSIKETDFMFKSIYRNSNAVLSLENIAFHLLETVGTMTRAFKDLYTFDEGREKFTLQVYGDRKTRFENEIADVFSWILATQHKIVSVYFRDAREYHLEVLGLGVSESSYSYADLIWSKYGRRLDGTLASTLMCPGCRHAPCQCERDIRLPPVDVWDQETMLKSIASAPKDHIDSSKNENDGVTSNEELSLSTTAQSVLQDDSVDSEKPPKIDVLLATIREDETRAVNHRLKDRRVYVGKNRTYQISTIQKDSGKVLQAALVKIPEQGPAAAQATITNAISDLSPSWILLVGIAGAMPDTEFSLGDVIVSTRVHDFTVSAALPGGESEFMNQGGPLDPSAEDLVHYIPLLDSQVDGWQSTEQLGANVPEVSLDDDRFYGDPDWKNKCKESLEARFNTNPVRLPIVTLRSIASSGQLVKNADLAAQWKEASREVAGVEMELAGAYRATSSRSSRVPLIGIRGISDIVGYKRSGAWTSFACESAASFCIALLKATPDPFFTEKT